MGINEKIKELYQKYIPEMYPVVYDGIVDEETFAKQKTKVLFLLKDGNDPKYYEDGNGYTYRDFRSVYEEGTKFHTMWRVMCMWMQIMEDDSFILNDCYSKENGYNAEEMQRYLKCFATVNVKKSPGESTCSDEALADAVNEYYSLIKEEIQLIKPNFVICGRTFDAVKDEYDVPVETLPNEKRYFIYDDCVYLEGVHPSPRGRSYEKMFNEFKETYMLVKKQLST